MFMGGMAFSVAVFLIIAAMVVCIIAIILNLSKPKLDLNDMPPCEPVEFCTKEEQSFHADLVSVAKKYGILVFAKVGLGCVLKPRRGVNNRPIWSKHLRCEYADFVLCDPASLKTLLVIMLDDSGVSLQKKSASTVDKACDQAGVPIMHVREYNLPGLEKALAQKIGPKKMPKAIKKESKEQPEEVAAS